MEKDSRFLQQYPLLNLFKSFELFYIFQSHGLHLFLLDMSVQHYTLLFDCTTLFEFAHLFTHCIHLIIILS